MAEYMTVKNNIVTGIFCGEAEKGSITLPDNHEVRVGEPLTFYNSDYTRKSEVQLIKEKLIELPQGCILDGDSIRKMTRIERMVAGLDKVPKYNKIVDGQLVPMTDEERLAEMSTEEKATYHRQRRDALIRSELWKLERHSQEIALGTTPTLSDTEYKSLLLYIQALRDLTKQEGFPNTVVYPTLA